MDLDQELEELLRPPLEFKCPIAQDVFQDPVVARDGHSYERIQIKRWFETGKRTSPMTNEVLPDTLLIPNLVLKRLIQEHTERAAAVRRKAHAMSKRLGAVAGSNSTKRLGVGSASKTERRETARAAEETHKPKTKAAPVETTPGCMELWTCVMPWELVVAQHSKTLTAALGWVLAQALILADLLVEHFVNAFDLVVQGIIFISSSGALWILGLAPWLVSAAPWLVSAASSLAQGTFQAHVWLACYVQSCFVALVGSAPAIAQAVSTRARLVLFSRINAIFLLPLLAAVCVWSTGIDTFGTQEALDSCRYFVNPKCAVRNPKSPKERTEALLYSLYGERRLQGLQGLQSIATSPDAETIIQLGGLPCLVHLFGALDEQAAQLARDVVGTLLFEGHASVWDSVLEGTAIRERHIWNTFLMWSACLTVAVATLWHLGGFSADFVESLERKKARKQRGLKGAAAQTPSFWLPMDTLMTGGGYRLRGDT